MGEGGAREIFSPILHFVQQRRPMAGPQRPCLSSARLFQMPPHGRSLSLLECPSRLLAAPRSAANPLSTQPFRRLPRRPTLSTSQAGLLALVCPSTLNTISPARPIPPRGRRFSALFPNPNLREC